MANGDGTTSFSTMPPEMKDYIYRQIFRGNITLVDHGLVRLPSG